MFDVIAEIAISLVSSFADWTARGTIITLSAASLGLAGLTTWLVFASSDSINRSAWEPPLIASCIVVGLIALFLSILHLIRDESDQALASTCVALNAAIVLVPVLWLMSQ